MSAYWREDALRLKLPCLARVLDSIVAASVSMSEAIEMAGYEDRTPEEASDSRGAMAPDTTTGHTVYFWDGLGGREGDTSLGRREPGRRDVGGVGLDGGRREIEAALLAERGVARDDRFSDPDARHLVGDDFLGVGECAGKLGAQPGPAGAEFSRSLGDISGVIDRRGRGFPAHALAVWG